MFRANLYSMEPLTTTAREAIHDGVEMVAAYMGQTVVAKELAVRLPIDELSNVNPSRVGFSKLDKLVELHLIAAPIDSSKCETVGLAYIGKGWSLVDTSRDNENLIRNITAHEVAHAFGFVIPESKHADKDSRYHCCDTSCIMHKKLYTLTASIEPEPQIQDKAKLLSRPLIRCKSEIKPAIQQEITVSRQFDFCSPCKVDMRNNSDQHLHQLRTGRILGRKV